MCQSCDGSEVMLEQAYGTANSIFMLEVDRHQQWLDHHNLGLKLFKRTDRAGWEKEWGEGATTFTGPIRTMAD